MILVQEPPPERTVDTPESAVGKVIEIHMDEKLAINRRKESVEVDPLVFMGTHYARVTGNLGRAFSVGRELR